MPVYEYRCNKCGEEHAELRYIKQRMVARRCKCGGYCKQILSPTPGIVKNPAVPRRGK